MESLDIFGQILWYLMFAAPGMVVLIFLRYKVFKSWLSNLLCGLALGVFISFILGAIAFAIVTRNGLGPG